MQIVLGYPQCLRLEVACLRAPPKVDALQPSERDLQWPGVSVSAPIVIVVASCFRNKKVWRLLEKFYSHPNRIQEVPRSSQNWLEEFALADFGLPCLSPAQQKITLCSPSLGQRMSSASGIPPQPRIYSVLIQSETSVHFAAVSAPLHHQNWRKDPLFESLTDNVQAHCSTSKETGQLCNFSQTVKNSNGECLCISVVAEFNPEPSQWST